MITVEVVYALRTEQQIVTLTLEHGTSARQALMMVLESGELQLAAADAALAPGQLPIGVYGLLVDDDYLLREGDRLEIYRPLLQDPMERRRKIARGKNHDAGRG